MTFPDAIIEPFVALALEREIERRIDTNDRALAEAERIAVQREQLLA